MYPNLVRMPKGLMEEQKTIDAFLAISVGGDLQERLSRVADSLKSAAPTAEWNDPYNYMVVLKELGASDPLQLVKLSNRLNDTLDSQNPFYLTLSHIGAYPSPALPREVWGVLRPMPVLLSLWNAVETAARRQGFTAAEKPFVPHVPLAKIENAQELLSVSQLLRKASVPPLSLMCRNVVMMKRVNTGAQTMILPVETFSLRPRF